MIHLGNVLHDGPELIGKRLMRQAREHGQVAAFVGNNGEAAAVAHYESDYEDALVRRFDNLLGVYRYDGKREQSTLRRLVESDLHHTNGSLPNVSNVGRKPYAPARKPRGRPALVGGESRPRAKDRLVRKASDRNAAVRDPRPHRVAQAPQGVLEVRECRFLEEQARIYGQVARGLE